MIVNVIRIIAKNHENKPDIRSLGDNLIEDINNLLINDDVLLFEGAK